MKTFKDLEFRPYNLITQKATIEFDNGYRVDVCVGGEFDMPSCDLYFLSIFNNKSRLTSMALNGEGQVKYYLKLVQSYDKE